MSSDIKKVTINLDDEKVVASKLSDTEENVFFPKVKNGNNAVGEIASLKVQAGRRKKSVRIKLSKCPESLPFTPDGTRFVKNISRVESIVEEPVPTKKTVPLFRLNSVISDKGSQLEGDEPQRQQWDNPIEFLMSCISMSVGLGNVWRFPHTAYQNGGGAFIIPYLLVILFVGRPLYYLELALGQFSSSGCVNVWDMVPALAGVGFGQAVACSCIITYFCVLIALAIYYLVASFSTNLPWTYCDPSLTIDNVTCVPVIGNSTIGDSNVTMSSADIYFIKGVLKQSTDISGGLGMPDTDLAVCLGICWLMMYFTLKNGVSGSGKVAYFTALFPYVVLFTFLIMACTLPGAGAGVWRFFKPEWSKLLTPGVWYAAVTQSFFSLGIGFGTLITFSSYNKFRHTTNRDALIISFADAGTSMLAGTVVFAILGNMAHVLGKDLDDVVSSGTGLAFVAYPVVIGKFSFCPQFFSVLFFLMLITLGVGSSVGMTSSVITIISDAFPSVNRKKIVKIICIMGFLLGLAYTGPGGQTALAIADYFGGSLLILVLGVLEVIGIAWIYGTNRIKTDIDFMLSTKVGEGSSIKWCFDFAGDLYWRFSWGIFCPIVLPLVLIYALVTQTGIPQEIPIGGGDPTNLPIGAYIIGGIVCATGILFVPIKFGISLYKGKGTLAERMAELFRPNEAWGPAGIQDRDDWVEYWDEEGETNPLNIIMDKFKKTDGKPAEDEADA